jgi:hypothetical protein
MASVVPLVRLHARCRQARIHQPRTRFGRLHRHRLHHRPDGKLYQLPDQQFANLYWFRADWFDRKDLKDRFFAKYGYELGVPLNWSAYEDIANFFTNDVKTLDGKKIYGHMDYGKRDPSLGWRFTDAWLSMAGSADKGIPNGLPVDEWGIRVAIGPMHTRGCIRRPRRRRQLPCSRICTDQIRGLAEKVCPLLKPST